MAKIILDIPDDLVDVIESLGFDAKSYLMVQAINPLLEKYKNGLNQAILERRKDEVESKVSECGNAVKVNVKRDKPIAVNV